jgi:hypothetical protein
VIEELQRYLAVLHRAFTNRDPDTITGRAIDVEFLVRRTPPRIVIVQARPYQMAWTRERLWRDEDGQPVE